MFNDPSRNIVDGTPVQVLQENAAVEIKQKPPVKSIYMVWDEPGIEYTKGMNFIETVIAVRASADTADMDLLVKSTPAGKVVLEVKADRKYKMYRSPSKCVSANELS
jgi:hypothetical protein